MIAGLRQTISLQTQFVRHFTRPSALQHLFTTARPDLLTQTSKIERSEEATNAVIVEIQRLTPTVKLFRLQVEDADFSFQAGQWIDLFIDGVSEVGGYSICSTPLQFRKRHCFDLAVKASQHRPAAWLHTKAHEGSLVQVRTGGNFVLRTEDASLPLLFVAGGIGITPIISLAAHSLELCESAKWPHSSAIMYSAKCTDELAFLSQLHSMQQCSRGGMRLTLRTTSNEPTLRSTAASPATHGRFQQEDVRMVAEQLLQQRGQGAVLQDIRAFVCGPPAMVDAMTRHLRNTGLALNQISHEQWW